MICLFGLGALQTDAAAADVKTFTWKMVTAWPPKFPIVDEAIMRTINNIETMSQGRLKIEHHPGGTLIPPLETFEAVRGGIAEMGSSCSYYWGGKVPEAPIFTTVSYGMTPQERISLLYNGKGLQLWHELYAPFNIVPFPMINTGVQMAGRSFKDILEANQRALVWRTNEIGQEIHGATKKKPYQVFLEEDKSTLKALPAEPLEIPPMEGVYGPP
jgi:TRAP-type mannitol/chloroaromatic compound transport system substrate-binding protein